MPTDSFHRTAPALAACVSAGAPARALPPWIPVVFPVLFVGMWLAVTTVLAKVAGHMALLARFPPADEPTQATFRWASGAMRGVRFNNALHVGLGSRGLHLAPNALFRPILRRGIPCVPWQEIRLVRRQPDGVAAWFRGSELEIPAVGVGFTLMGAAGRAVERKLSTGQTPAEPLRSRLVRE